ncbi:MAG: GGDEF domain-containing protein [Alphaproteobacteria bacterium]|nr:GGDEF domain-containing protein [Alphaproteobacteria bacterium]
MIAALAAAMPAVTGLLTATGVLVVFGLFAAFGYVLFDARNLAWREAGQSASNIARALDQEIARNVELYHLSLQAVRDGLRTPGVAELSPALRNLVLFDRAATARYLGSLLVLDAAGNIVIDSASPIPRKGNFSDRDYFRFHRDNPDPGLHISHPFQSRLERDYSFGLSLRLSNPDGSFAGIVIGTMRLALFHEMFGDISLGPHGAITLVMTDGTILMRQPFHYEDVGRNIAASHAGGDDLAHRLAVARSGLFEGTAVVDGITRLFAYSQVADYPLIVHVGFCVEDIFAGWEQKALTLGLMALALCAATVALVFLFRHELGARLHAEARLQEVNRELAKLARTDALTGLGNRLHFDQAAESEWNRAMRGQSSIAMLMLDADWFKAYNDRYGHPEGDRVLRALGACISECLRRAGDLGARYGGEEFAVLLPATDAAGALQVADKIHQALQQCAIEHAGSPIGRVTVSIGAAVAAPDFIHGGDVAGLLAQADQALYRAKQNGRNRTVLFQEAAVPGLALPI